MPPSGVFSSDALGTSIPADAFAASVHANLVVACRCDVAHPRERLVAALFNDLQVAHLWANGKCGSVGEKVIDLSQPGSRFSR